MKGRAKQRKMAAHFRPSGWTLLVRGLRKIRTRVVRAVDIMRQAFGLLRTRQDQYVLTDGDHHHRERIKAAEQRIHDMDTSPKRAAPCTDHRPVQHRDARPPWCNACGLTSGGVIPTGPLDRDQSGDRDA